MSRDNLVLQAGIMPRIPGLNELRKGVPPFTGYSIVVLRHVF